MENPVFKNRMKLANEVDTFDIDELNTIIDNQRIEFMINLYIQIMDAKRLTELDELYKKMKLIAKATKDMKSISNVFGRFWDLSVHDLYQMDMSFIHRMNELLSNRPFIQKIAELLGRAASAFNEYEDFLIKEMIFIPSNKKYIYSPENLIGVTQGNSIPDLLPISLAYRKRKKTKQIFKIQFIEKKLLQFEKIAKGLDEIEISRSERRLKKDSKGPFILVIDTSGSMHGEPEIMAKAMALAFINIANKEDRKCYIINFSTNTIEFDASEIGKSWDKLYNFLSYSFSGGTDIGPAIESAVKKVEDDGYKNSDVIFISDMIINSLGQNLNKRVEELKKKKIRWHSLTIGNSYHPTNTDFLDNNWIYDGSQNSIDKIIKDLDKYTEKK